MYSRYSTSRCASQTTVIVVGLIYAFEWYIYHFVCKPFWAGAVLFNVAFILAIWSYLQTALTDPGTPQCSEWQEWSTSRTQRREEEGRIGSPPRTSTSRDRSRCWRPGEVTWCPDCQAERPERAHHCSQCGYCVLRMDHHCPWVGTCIGWRNHKYFLLLNWWSCWASVCWLWTVRNPSMFEALTVVSTGEYGPHIHPSLLPIIGALLALCFAIITGGMFCFSLSMVCRNVTAIEDFYPGVNPYCYPCSADNVRQVVGAIGDLRILLPVDPLRRLNGIHFPLASKAPPSGLPPLPPVKDGGYGTIAS